MKVGRNLLHMVLFWIELTGSLKKWILSIPRFVPTQRWISYQGANHPGRMSSTPMCHQQLRTIGITREIIKWSNACTVWRISLQLGSRVITWSALVKRKLLFAKYAIIEPTKRPISTDTLQQSIQYLPKLRPNLCTNASTVTILVLPRAKWIDMSDPTQK